LRNKRILEQAKKKAQKKALCLALELEAKREAVNAEPFNYPAALIGIEQSSIVWATLETLNAAIARHSRAKAISSNL
jgi:hypothetical protein